MSSNDIKEKKITVKHEFIMLAIVFLSPIIISAWLYNNLDKWQQGGRNNGNLIEPPKALHEVAMIRKNGEFFRFSDYKGKWLLVQIDDAECNKECENTLLKSRQGRLSQGGNIGRVQRLLMVKGNMENPKLIEVLKEHREVIVASAEDEGFDEIVSQFRINENDKVLGEHRVYIVDPNGFVIMSYEKDFPAIHLIKDLMHVLKYSRIG